MNSMFIGVIAVLLGLLVNESNGYNGLRRESQNNNDVNLDLERTTELYDTIVDLITDQDEAVNSCETRINNLGNLLDATFEHCSPAHPCQDKDTFLADAKVHCNEYKDVEDFVKITGSSNTYDYSITLSVKLIHLLMDDCEMTKTYNEVVTYNDGGLITKIVPSDHKETLICPSSEQPTTTEKYAEEPEYGQESPYIEEAAGNSYGEEQEPEPEPPVAVDDYVTTDINTPVMIDVLDNDYDPDQPEVSGKKSLEIADFNQGSMGTVEDKGNKLRYKPNKDECGTDTFTYWIQDLDDGLRDSADVHITIPCPPEYEQESESPYIEESAGNSYMKETTATPGYNDGDIDELETRKLKNLKVDVAVEDPTHPGFVKVTDIQELEYIIADIESLKAKLNKDGNHAEISLGEAYAKDISEYRTTYRCSLQYVGHEPEPKVLDDGSVVRMGGAQAYGYIEYDVIDAYDEKKDTVRKMAAGLGRALCKSKGDKMDDIDNKNKFCDDLVYEAECHSDSCSMFKNSLNDRDSYLHLMKQYENIFDEATLEIEDGVIILDYRKGKTCSGQFTQKVEIDYDEDRQCISKWIDYLDDVTMTDKDCDNSMAKLFEKLETKCQFDVESGGYDTTEPANQYGSGSGSELAPEANDDELMVGQNEMTLLYVLANDRDPNHPDLSGRDALDIIDVTNGNKGQVHISPASKRLRYVANDGECGSDSFEYTVVNQYGLSDTATVYITINCDGYRTEPDDGYVTEPDVTELDTGYVTDEKNEKIRELMGKLGDVACKSKSDTFDDEDIKTRFCVDIEYEAICNDEDKCGSFAGGCKGRSAFLEFNRKYQDMFDEATLTYEDDAFLVEYRKGSCSGYYDIRAVIDYDSDKQCISKWTDYYDDLILSDQECEDSADKWMNKIQNECQYDDGNDKKVNKTKILNSFYRAAFDCRLKKNQGNTELLNKFMRYLSDSSRLCVMSGNDETCHNKDEIRTMMSDRYVDDNESIDYHVDITYDEDDMIEAKCTSRRLKSNGCIVIKEEYDTCVFNDDGSIKEFKVNRQNKETKCEDEDAY